jgi:hypothetical protein
MTLRIGKSPGKIREPSQESEGAVIADNSRMKPCLNISGWKGWFKEDVTGGMSVGKDDCVPANRCRLVSSGIQFLSGSIPEEYSEDAEDEM